VGAFYFKIENRRDILNTTLLTRITAYKVVNLYAAVWRGLFPAIILIMVNITDFSILLINNKTVIV